MLGDDLTRFQMMAEGGGAGEEYEEEVDDYANLKKFWMNEHHSPLILPYQSDTVDSLVELIKNQQALIEAGNVKDPMLICIYQTEMERIKYCLSSYLRCRLSKIEKLWAAMTNESRSFNTKLLSEGEQRYLRNYAENVKRTKNQMYLDHLPPSLKANIDCEDYADVEDAAARKHVICMVVDASIGNVQVDPRSMESVELQKGDIYALQFGVVEPLLRDGRVILI